MERYTVAELTGIVADLLGAELNDVWVEGEVSGFKPHGSGHWYFTLKDANAVLSCAMFRGDNLKVRKPPRDGDRVLVRGGVDVYPPRGTYSLIVRRMEPVGAGELQRKLEELRARLLEEGLFDPARKRPIPRYPEAIGVATSQTGAALQDILRVVWARYPGMPIYLAPCKVQGEGAAADVAKAIALLNAHGKSSVLLVGRGGGSVEDLWAFNEEPVVRAVVGSRIPVVSAVGHEVDVSLCDLAADARAATPSHAAELVTPVRDELLAWVDEQAERLELAMRRRTAVARDRVARVRLQHPRQKLERARLRCDELEDRLGIAVQRRVGLARERLNRVRLVEPRIQLLRARVTELQRRLQPGTQRVLAMRRERLRSAVRGLDALSPLAVLDRGYAIVRKGDHVVRQAAELSAGDLVNLRLGEGTVDARVVE